MLVHVLMMDMVSKELFPTSMSQCNNNFMTIVFVLIVQWLPVQSQLDNFIIAGYLPEYRSYINVNASSLHLTDLMLFSTTPETIMRSDKTGGCCVSSEHFEMIRKARLYKTEKQNQQLRLILTVGGAGRSSGFAQIVGGGLQIQRKFVNEMVKLW